MTTATNVMGGERPRNEADAYFTPEPLAHAICRKLASTIPHVATIVEPSAGVGSFVRAARDCFPAARIHAVEPNQDPAVLRGAGAAEVFRQRWEDELPSWIRLDGPSVLVLGNPPFDPDRDAHKRKPIMAERHAALSLRRLGHGTTSTAIYPSQRYLAFLLPSSFASTKGRYERMFGPRGLGGLRWRWDIVERPSFTGDGGSMMVEYTLFVWQAGWRGLYEGGWLSWQ